MEQINAMNQHSETKTRVYGVVRLSLSISRSKASKIQRATARNRRKCATILLKNPLNFVASFFGIDVLKFESTKSRTSDRSNSHSVYFQKGKKNNSLKGSWRRSSCLNQAEDNQGNKLHGKIISTLYLWLENFATLD